MMLRLVPAFDDHHAPVGQRLAGNGIQPLAGALYSQTTALSFVISFARRCDRQNRILPEGGRQQSCGAGASTRHSMVPSAA